MIPESNVLQKYMKDPNFFEERRRKLEIYINYLNNSEFFTNTVEVSEFINQKEMVKFKVIYLVSLER